MYVQTAKIIKDSDSENLHCALKMKSEQLWAESQCKIYSLNLPSKALPLDKTNMIPFHVLISSGTNVGPSTN